MKTLVIYYSYTGSSGKLAKRTAAQIGADIFEVVEKRKRGTVNAYVTGSIAAMRKKKTEIEPITVDFNAYDKIYIMAPIWAGKPAPAINNVLESLPSGKEVTFHAVSASGSSRGRDTVEAMLQARGCKLDAYVDVKGAEIE